MTGFTKKLDSGGYEGDIKKAFKVHAKTKALKKKVSSITQSKKERRRGDTSGASDSFFHSNER